jgi:hypothetical protein
MAHCPYDRLSDLEDVFALMRTWPGMKEPKPGIFYVGRTAFLHFHVKDERRWADVREGADFASIDIPPGAGAPERRCFLDRVQRQFRKASAPAARRARG